MSRRRKALWVLLAFLLALALLFILRESVRDQAEQVPAPTLQISPSPSAVPTPGLTEPPTPAALLTPTPTPVPTPSPAPLRSAAFELPLEGATGYTSVSMRLRAQPSTSSKLVATLKPGTPFRILGESGAWWKVKTEGLSGYLAHKYCLINLPDIVPSIVYDATNTYSSVVVSSGKALPSITGRGLYPGAKWNARLQKDEFIMPVLYSMAPKIYAAQKAARTNGETLVIYEAYRPYDVQMTIVDALRSLADRDRTVMRGISGAPWSLSWFASTRLSNHQRGCAVDVSLAKVNSTKEARSGAYGYTRVTGATRYDMPTAMHELSAASAIFTAPVDSKSRTAWKNATPAASANKAALRLQKYCAQAGLTPLASEWWHFNDLDAVEANASNQSTGRYTLAKVLSAPP